MPKAEPEIDEYGKQLEDALRANKAILTGLKYDAGQKIAAAAEGLGEMPSAIEMAALKKFEMQVQNDELFMQARAMTRRRSEAK